MNKKIGLGMLAFVVSAFSAAAFAGDVLQDAAIQVPEPGTLSLLAAGIVGTVVARLKKRK